MNEQLILDYLKEHGEADTEELLNNLDISLETLVNALDALKEHEKIEVIK
jgi:DeoR/GlpR family transcriptional regulator of sugar metabolism